MIKLNDVIYYLGQKGVGYKFLGDEKTEIKGFSSLGRYKKETITWVKSPDYVKNVNPSDVSCALVKSGSALKCNNTIYVDDPKGVFFDIIGHFWRKEEDRISRGLGTIISDKAIIGENVRVGNNCTIEAGVIIGDNTIIEHSVVIMKNVSIGSACIIHSGAILGKEGDGYLFDEKNIPRKIKHYGGVRIGDRVEIGANSVVDCGTIDDTVVENDVKICSLVVVGHNTMIGKGAMILSGAIICGSAEIGEKAYIAPAAVIRNHISVGNNVFVGLNTVADKEVSSNSMVYNSASRQVKMPNYRRML